MDKSDVSSRGDLESITARFYADVFKDPIIGYIFTDIANVDLATHLPRIVDFWADSLFGGKSYEGNTLGKHLELHKKIELRQGHFTRWLYLFERAVDAQHAGANAEKMKQRAELVANAIAAAIGEGKKRDMRLTLGSQSSDQGSKP